MESKPVSTKQKESLVTILIDNVPVSISTKRYNQLIEWIDRYNSYQIGLEIYPPESNIHKQYAIKSKIALETLKSSKMNYKKKIQEIQTEINIINKYYINQVASPSKETINKLEELTKEHYILLKKYYEKSQDIRLMIVSLFQGVFIFCILMTIIKFIIEN
jgi:hypothetical protein